MVAQRVHLNVHQLLVMYRNNCTQSRVSPSSRSRPTREPRAARELRCGHHCRQVGNLMFRRNVFTARPTRILSYFIYFFFDFVHFVPYPRRIQNYIYIYVLVQRTLFMPLRSLKEGKSRVEQMKKKKTFKVRFFKLKPLRT